ncbi:MAG TPA: alpha/beta fold hydrolase [Acidimicrobiales bacterium]|nr:alpha/beta fold hydrolase [Acidimicrobiales bacterium]
MPHVQVEKGRRVHYEASSVGPTREPMAFVFHHGQPGAAVLWQPMVAESARRGWPLVMVSRPGYATSDRKPERLISDVVGDIAAVLDHLEIDRFVTAGWSGGGPHALACAALLDSRCSAAATIAGVAPYEGADDLDFTAGMGPENVEEFQALIAGDPAVEARVEDLMRSLEKIQASELVAALGGLLSEPDKAVLEGEEAEFMASWMRLSASTGYYGYWDDGLAFIRHWGFDLDDLEVPVTVWRAGQDLMVPPAHGEWLAAHIPTANSRSEPDEGHISLLTNQLHVIVDQLATDAGIS